MSEYPCGHVSTVSQLRGFMSILCELSRSCSALAKRCTASYISAVSVCKTFYFTEEGFSHFGDIWCHGDTWTIAVQDISSVCTIRNVLLGIEMNYGHYQVLGNKKMIRADG
jgi:hypothetical protein